MTASQQPTTASNQPPNRSSGLLSPNKLYQVGQGAGGQNFLNQDVVMATSSRPGLWKSLVLDILVVLFAGFFGYSFAAYLGGNFSIWIPLAGLLLWCAASVLVGFLQKKFSHRFLVIVLESIALIAWFYTYAWQALAVAFLVTIFVLVWGYFSVQRELRNTIEVRFFTASGKVVGKVVTAAVIFMIIMYAALTNNNGNFFVSQNGFNFFFNWAAGVVNNFYPTVPLNSSFGDFAQAVARMQLQGDPAFQSLTPAEQDAALSQSASQIVSSLSNNSSTAMATTTPAAASEPTSDAIYGYLASVAAKLQSRFNGLFVGGWGLILFLILRSIGIIVVWIGQFVALLFYELLLATRFMKISEQPATKEVIEY